MLRSLESGLHYLRPKLTPEDSARWKRRLRDPLTISFTVTCGLLFVLTVMLAVRLYSLRREVTLLRIEQEATERERQVWRNSVRKELDTIYQTLYSPPEAVTPLPRTPSQVELWQRNRDKELRDRIARLEQWRLRQER